MSSLRALVAIDGERAEPGWGHIGQSPFAGGNWVSYLARSGYTVGKLLKRRGLCIEPYSRYRVYIQEKRFVRFIAENNDRSTAMRAALIRLAGRLLRKLSGKPIWLISDQAACAGNNGEALFAYLMRNKAARRGVRPVFLLDRNSADWRRLKRQGSTVACNSLPHKLLFLAADKVIAPDAGEQCNPFGEESWMYRTLFNFDFVFLEPEVTLHDLPRRLNRANANIALFVTAGQRERQAILDSDAGYPPDQVAQTGFPRHDKLLRRATHEMPQRLVAVMPTWRTYLAGKPDPQNGRTLPNPTFEKSAYCRFWNGLLNHPRLLETLQRRNYRLRFVVHPNFSQESDTFQARDLVEITPHADGIQTFCEAALLLTDYAPEVFDFALLRKPIVYAQFDTEDFYRSQQHDKSWFDYSRDGFGPVCTDLESTVKAVIRYLDMDDCRMEDEYRERVANFYGPQPENRCQALVDAIKKLGRRS